jgi:hypothetical protein
MEWVFAHMEDPDFNDPLPPPAAAAAGAGAQQQQQDPEKVSWALCFYTMLPVPTSVVVWLLYALSAYNGVLG